ncbi:MAG: DNA repair protein RecN, partial [Opitutales bacterium]|nr:DNA repair protein RecN [Opitutales bacterium]
PLNKIASAGETARIMLALKAMLAEADATPVLVFDEVDANVGGEIAVHVARKLAEVSRTHQIFCITHLAQVAALGDHHFCVTKTQSDNATKIDISRLDENSRSREDELARMLGDRHSPAALAHARELLTANC